MSNLLEKTAAVATLAFAASANGQVIDYPGREELQTFKATLTVLNMQQEITVTPRGNLFLQHRDAQGKVFVEQGGTCSTFANNASDAVKTFAVAASLGAVSAKHEQAGPQYKADADRLNQDIVNVISQMESVMNTCLLNGGLRGISNKQYQNFYDQTQPLKTTLKPKF